MPTMMSIYQAKKPYRQFDDFTTLLATTTTADTKLVQCAIETGKPALVGLDGVHTIVKPVVSGDEGLTFESLYDDALTVTDLNKMEDAGVKRPEDVPPTTFRLQMTFPVQFLAGMDIAILAPSASDIRPVFRDLVLSDRRFQMAIFERLIQTFTAMLADETELVYTIEDVTSVPPAPALKEPLNSSGEKWRILADD